MKKSAFIIVVLMFFLSVGGIIAQIKVFSSGKVSLNTITEPSIHNGVYLYGPRLMMGGWQNRFLKLDVSASDPRLWSSTNKIVLFNTEQRVYQDLEIRTLYQTSDEKFKTNIESIENALDVITQLRGTTFDWKDSKERNSQRHQKEVGFIAQEVERVLPEAVLTDSLNTKLLSYNSILTYAVEAIKELSYMVEKQEQELAALKNGSQLKNAASQPSSTINDFSDRAVLLSNVPNPFTDISEIGYYLPIDGASASLVIFDLNGKQVKNIPVHGTGNGKVSIAGSELGKGMYLYTLIVNGQEIDTKRMIVM